ncbi:uroporphyrinogen decarboxylase family protein [Ruminococcus gauvreauii]|uniref:Uroporphyrinogen decarboxylase family protein n=1 Tax=Ruminococcus gauvreauii TaxID=438033 RepID=A0ABY5VI67_9FIRM|nr:uroporphyrinogen decarboxylase family protein [Ruminococcus gauvreauii]UWP60092.1 uroporphyrinogen decarboxylase family protein [Ruminococcus gauvreauii]
MTSKERVLASLNHKQPDKIPIDFGGHVCSMMNATCVAALREYYGLEKRPVRIWDVSTMTGEIEKDLQDALGVDCEPFPTYDLCFGLKNTERWKSWKYRGTEVLVPENFEVTDDGKGGYYIYPEGDTSVPPSGHLPAGGYYFDDIVRQKDLEEDSMNYEDNLEEYGPISDTSLEFLRLQADNLKDSEKAVVMVPGGSALGDAANIPGNSLKDPKGIRSIPDWFAAPLLYPDYVHNVYSHQVDRMIDNWTKIYDIVGETVDVAYICGADFGTQISQMCSMEVFDEFYLPYYKRINDWVHKHTGWKTLKHTCGAVYPFIPKLIEAGFDAVNPVQCSAKGMDPRRLKKEFGNEITFWGGGVDTQKILPFGTPEQIREQVLERCEIFGEGGGFIFNSIHIVQCNTPVENIVAMINAVHEYNGN